MSTFSDRLKELRGSESQSSFAAQIELNRVQYAKYESGVNAPSIEVLTRICRVHACSADWLLGLSEDRGGVHSAAPTPQVTKSRQKVCEPQFDYLTKFAALEQRVKALEAAAIIELNRPTAACCG